MFSSDLLDTIPCNFPFVPLNCTQTFADVSGSQYVIWKVVYLAAGGIGVLLTLIRIPGILKRGSDIQRACFPFLFIAFGSFIVRGLDPNGYEGMIPKIIVEFAGTCASCCLYSICCIIAVLWGSLLQSYSANWRIPAGIRLFGLFLTVSTWVLCLVLAFYVAGEPVQKYDVHVYVAIQLLSYSALGMVLMAYFIYTGAVLHRRLVESFDGSNETAEPAAGLSTPTGSIEVDYGPSRKKSVVAEAQKRKCWTAPLSIYYRWTNLPRITRMLVIFCIASTAAIVVMSALAYSMLSDGYLFAWQEYSLCLLYSETEEERATCPIEFDGLVLSVLQLVLLFLCVWAFWRLPPLPEKSQTASEPGAEDLEEEQREEELLRDDGKRRTMAGKLSNYAFDMQKAADGKLSEHSSFMAEYTPPDFWLSSDSFNYESDNDQQDHFSMLGRQSVPYQVVSSKKHSLGGRKSV